MEIREPPKKVIQKLNARHYKILELSLRGLTTGEIAKAVGLTTTAIMILQRSASFQHEIAMRRSQINEISNQRIVEETEDVSDSIKRATREAVKRLTSCISSDNEAIALRASTEILDRGGFPRTQRNESKSFAINISSKDASIIQETLSMLSKTGDDN
jgi:transcriptional regulator